MGNTPTNSAALPASLALTGGKSRALRIPRRPVKIFTAGSLALAGAYGILSEQRYVSSSNAVVSAYVLDIRTPIDGTITGLASAPGIMVRSGEVLAHLDNPLVDHQHLDNVRTLEEVAQSTADADRRESSALDAQRRSLVARAQAHAKAVTARLAYSVSAAESTLAERRVAESQANGELERGGKLYAEGIVPRAEYEKLVTAAKLAHHGVETSTAELANLRTQREAARLGMMSEPGTNNDVAYSRQRADELAMKLAETERSMSSSQAQARQAHIASAAEEQRAVQMRSSDLRSPISGLIWRLDAIDGERAAAGDPVLSLVDCRHQFLLAEVPQERLPDIAIGRPARFRLTGEAEERTGMVVAATGDPQKELNRKFAAYPLQDPAEQLAVVRIQIDQPSSAGCTIGRTARVLLPTEPTTFAGRWLRQYF